MKNILRFLICTLTFIAGAWQSKATHVAAADIYYEYLAPLTYKVHLILYRDCKINAGGGSANATLLGTESMTATSASCGQSINFTVDTTGNNTKVIYGDLCPNIANWCTDFASIFPGYEEWHYSDTLVLPMACTDWRFNFDLCCRNNVIGNLNAPGGQSLCVSAGLNNIARPVNNSTVLSIKPIPYVCVNQPKTYLNGPLDPDFDSLNFVSSNPLGQAGCGPITWNAAMAASTANPFGNNTVPPGPPGYVVNSNTGTATFFPTVQNTYVIAFTCYEIDPITNDTVGFVMRDVQLNVLNCNSAPPSSVLGTQCYNPNNLSGGYLQPVAPPACPDVIETCPGSTLTFEVEAISQSLSNLVITYANNAASCPGSTYTSNPPAGGSPVTGTFTWTPNGTQIGNHTLIITFMDSTCTTAQPIVLKSYAIFLIKVLPGVDAGPDLVYCFGADSIQLGVTGPPSVTQWQWSDINGNTTGIGLSANNIANPKAAPTGTTTYIVEAINPPPGVICKIKDTITVTLVNGVVVVNAGGPSTICMNDSIGLGATATPAQAAPTILWTPAADLSANNIMNPWASPLATTTYQLTYRDDVGCVYTRNHVVNVNGSRPLLNSQVSVNPVCPGKPFQLFTNVSSMPCGLSVFSCNSPSTTYNVTVGTGNIQQSQFTPYVTSTANSYRTQMLYTAGELIAAGIKAGNINSASWFVVGKGSDTMRNVRIKMGCTDKTILDGTTGFITGLSQVYAMDTLFTAQGWNVHQFNNAYFWDGYSNIVVELCYNITGVSPNTDIIASSNTPGNQMMHQTGPTNACGMAAAAPLIGAIRPNTRFNVCEVGTFTFSWTPSQTLDNSSAENPFSSGITNTTDFVITATAASNPNCVSTDVVQVTVDNSTDVTASVNPAILCGPGLVTLSATTAGIAPQYYCGEEGVTCSSPHNKYPSSTTPIGSVLGLTPFNGNYSGGRTQMIFTIAELNAMGITKGRIDSIGLNVITKTSFSTFNMAIKVGCTNLNQLSNGFVPAVNLKEVYSNNAYPTTLGWNNFVFSTPFLWDGTSNLLLEICFFNGTGNFIQPDAVEISSTAPNVQFYTQSSDFGGCEIPSVSATAGPLPSQSRPIINFYVCDIPVKPWKFRWDPALFVYDSTAATTTAYVNSSGWYHIHSTGGNGCEVNDSVQVILSTHDIEVTPLRDSICLGDRYQAYAKGFGSAPSETFLWTDESGGSVGLSCTTCTDPIITPVSPGVHTFYAIRTDTYGCSDTAKTEVLVYPNPPVTIINGDSVTIKYKEQVNLIATGGITYNWTPAWNSSNPNDSSTIVSPSEPTLYYVYSINELGCRYYDSILVNINYRDNLFVPTAFSPDGDGTNDVFKVTNITFQAIQEFKVMNRWGQVVFNATDNRGWDGTFKGVKQNMDTYYYLIKVAFPDGPTKTLKGDVILVR